MPLYPFACRSCDVRFERLLSQPPAAPPPCPDCLSPDTTRVLSRPAKGPAARPAAPAGVCGVGPPCGRTGCGRIPDA